MAAPMDTTKTPETTKAAETPAMDATQAPEAVKRLVDNFAANIDEYKSGNYNETQVRVEYIDKLYAALGWDIHNDQGNAEAYKDVIHEYSLRSQPDQKGKQSNQAPDYCFRAGGEDKFFLETKRPAANISESAAHAFQLRSYGWSAKLPISILSDFEELAVYDCQVLPKASDSPATARVLLYHYQDYISKWQEIHSIFYKQAVYNGSFDRFTISDKKKKGTLPVDKAFLQEMEGWRTLLARNIALRNSELSQKQLNHLVQATIDRIVFLRICEDRDIEPYKQLQNLLTTDNVYQELCLLFQKADDKYNSGLFHFRSEKNRLQPDALSLTLTIDNKPLTDIITKLYYPNPYVFSEIPAEILGQVYEQFLGKVIRLTAGHRAKVEEKPEVRKAGGVYYTPKYIVDYIVKNTVGELLKNKTPKQAKKIKILDPACGSGSFLIVAYQFLLDWYLSAYSKDPSKHKKLIYKTTNGNHYRLATQEKKDILLNHIFGVDIDRQAGEVTKLSLLLKVLEDENTGTLEAQRKMFQERALPDLGNNIKCGNSLIGSDFFHDKNLDMFDREQMENINAFDWDGKDGFPEIMQAGGFDCVIGNPPYVRQESLGDNFKAYVKTHYETFAGSADLYVYFMEKGLGLINKHGLYSIIVVNKWMQAKYGQPLRDFLLGRKIFEIIDFGDLPVFQGATTYPCIVKISNSKSKQGIKSCKISELLKLPTAEWLLNTIQKKAFQIDKKSLGSTWALNGKADTEVLQKIAYGTRLLGDLVGITRGFRPPPLELVNNKNAQEKYLIGKDIKGAYIIDWSGNRVHYLEERVLESKALTLFKKPKIVFRDIGLKFNAYFDEEGLLCLKSIYFIYAKDAASVDFLKYLTGFLNSRLANYYFKLNFSIMHIQGGYLRFRKQFVELMPIKLLDLANPKQKAQHDHMVQLVDQMLDTQKKRHASKSEDDASKHFQEKADILDKQIDTLVYELYELTEKEIRVVAGG